MARERAKRRSLSQRIGKKGEALVQFWATDNHLTVQKVDDDYGIDFFCQIMMPVSSSKEEATGQLLAIQVKSITGTSRKRIKLDRADVENALRVQASFCLLGVDVASKKIHFKFIDLDFLYSLHRFLCSDKKTTTFNINEFSSDDVKFKLSLLEIANLSYQQKLRHQKAALDLKAVIPGGLLEIQQSMHGSLAIAVAPWITSFFKVDPKKQNKAASIFFEKGKLPKFNQGGFELKPEVSHLEHLVDGPTILLGGKEADVTYYVSGQEGTRKTTVKYRRLGDERAYVFPSGLILAISDSRNRKGQWIHEFRHSVTDIDAKSLGDSKSDIEFLKAFKEGGSIGEKRRALLPIEHWGNLKLLGPEIEALELICSKLGIDLNEIFLKDALDSEIHGVMDLVRALIDGVPMYQLIPGFVIGPATALPYSEENWVSAGYRIPVVANFKEKGIILWIEGEGQLYRGPKNIFCGFRAISHSKWSKEIRPTRFSKGMKPELWLFPDWPPIPLFTSSDSIKRDFQGGECLEFGGDVWPINSE